LNLWLTLMASISVLGMQTNSEICPASYPISRLFFFWKKWLEHEVHHSSLLSADI
jgi:hypothetical protein